MIVSIEDRTARLSSVPDRVRVTESRLGLQHSVPTSRYVGDLDGVGTVGVGEGENEEFADGEG